MPGFWKNEKKRLPAFNRTRNAFVQGHLFDNVWRTWAHFNTGNTAKSKYDRIHL